jgi:aspartokinase/homoserine dehydrogenase 1
VLKFGGSSLATPERIRAVAEILREAASRGPLAAVVSALGGVTDGLLTLAQKAADRDESYQDLLAELRRRHQDAVEALARPEDAEGLRAQIETAFTDLAGLARGAYLLREASPRTLDHLAGYGERLSAPLVAATLVRSGLAAEACDTRRLIVTDRRFGAAVVDAEATYGRLREHFAATQTLQVVTGFIAATSDGETTTLGRGGSDYTASLLGAALDAEAVELWTDVDGVLSGDPRLIPRAFPQPEISYRELAELSHFGAKVVYPPSVHPTRERSIPLLIKNTFRPEVPGTRVVEEAADDGRLIRGVASASPVALLLVEGDGMVGVPGIAMRLFGALARDRISVILISQASSEHSICLAVPPEAVDRARRQIEEEFALELRLGLIDPLVVEDDLAVLAVVGEQMRERPGISGRLFQVLGDHGVNVRAIAQGSSERNISWVVAREDEARALNAVHSRFFFPRQAPARRRSLSLVVVGPGRVGRVLLDQIATRKAGLAAEGIDLKLRAILRRGRGAVARDCLESEGGWRQSLSASDESPSLEDLFEELRRGDERVALVDCTASRELPEAYSVWLEEGFAVVSANKLAFAGPLASWRRIRAAARASGAGLFFETTVGAGLPVIRTLEDLLATGDEIEGVEGTFSGTLS